MLKEIIISIQSFFEAHRFIKKHRLWKWIIVPGIIYCILFIAGMYLFGKTSSEATSFILQKSGLKTWLDSKHESWLNWLVIMGQFFIIIILFLFYFSLFKFIFFYCLFLLCQCICRLLLRARCGFASKYHRL